MTQTPRLPKLNINEVKAEFCRRNFFYFLQTFWNEIIPEDPVYNWHMKFLCDELQAMVEMVARREDKLSDALINIPPGTSKSTICTVMLPVWAWIIDPRIRVLTASYSAALSTDHSTKSRDIIRSAKFKAMFPEIQVRKDVDNKSHYKNTKGGERLATSVTGTVTGFHAHLIIVDDPLNPKEAQSDVERERANNFMDVTLSTRKISKTVTPTILVMQRLHQNDCSGNILQKNADIKHICLPAELSDDVRPLEAQKFYKNNLLDTERLNYKALNELKVALGSYGYAGQMMQIPAPLDGGIFQKWFIPVATKDIPKDLQYLGSDWDLAYTEKEQNSASAFVTAGLKDKKMYITAAGYKHLEFPQLMAYMESQQKPHYIEAKASGKSAKQTLTNKGIPAIEVSVTGGDKVGRALLSSPYMEAGQIYCDERFLQLFYNDANQSILMFPNANGDDLVDALVQSINRLLARGEVIIF